MYNCFGNILILKESGEGKDDLHGLCRKVMSDLKPGFKENRKPEISAVVAAAGLSSRMGDFKPLLRLGNTTMIGRLIASLKAAGVQNLIVVTGHKSELLENHLRNEGVTFVKNERYASTDMLASVKLGIRCLPENTGQVFVTPADAPLTSPEILKLMLEREGEAVSPVYEGKIGHPLLLRKKGIEKLLAWTGPNGVRGLADSGLLEISKVETKSPAVLLDADTPEEYRELLSHCGDLCKAEKPPKNIV